MKKKYLSICIGALVLAAGIAFLVIYTINNRFVYNEDNASGNTAGNLINGGLFCEYQNKIYFANPANNNYLYRMNPDCSNPEQLNKDSVAYINVYGNYIYYVKNNFDQRVIGAVLRGSLFGLYRTDLNGQGSVSLYQKLTGTLALCGNYIYYQRYDGENDMALWKIRIDKKDEQQISRQNFDPSCVYNGNIYFSNIGSDHNIMKLNAATDTTSVFYYGNTYLPAIEGNYLYYIDLKEKYSLKRFNMGNKTLELITEGKCINYNVIGSKVFYVIEGEAGGLYRSNTDGSAKERIAEGNVASIHCTSQYTFFQFYEESGVLYRVPSLGRITKLERIEIK